MSKHAVVRTDLMSGTDVRADLVSVKYMGEDGKTATEIDNGCVLKVGSLMDGERDIFVGEVPAADDALNDIVLVATPEVIYDEHKHNISDFYNEAGKPIRGYRLRSGNIFSVTEEALDMNGTAVASAEGKVVELQAGVKMKVSASATGTQVGTIEAVENSGRYTYLVIRVK